MQCMCVGMTGGKQRNGNEDTISKRMRDRGCPLEKLQVWTGKKGEADAVGKEDEQVGRKGECGRALMMKKKQLTLT